MCRQRPAFPAEQGLPFPQNGSGALRGRAHIGMGISDKRARYRCILQGRGKRGVKGPPCPQNGSGALRGMARVGMGISDKRARVAASFKAEESAASKARLARRTEVERCAAWRASGWAYPTNARVLLHPSRPRKARRQRPTLPAERKWSGCAAERTSGWAYPTNARVLLRPFETEESVPSKTRFSRRAGLAFPAERKWSAARQSARRDGHIRRFCNRPRICTGHSNIHLNGPAAAHSPHDFYRRGRAGRFRLYRLPLYSGSDRGFSAITGGVHARVRGIVQKPEALRPVSQPPRITGEWRQAQWRAPITPIDSIIYNKISFVNKCSKKRVHLDALTIPLPNGLPSRFACQGGCGRLCKTL